MTDTVAYAPSEFPIPPGIDFSKFSIKREEARNSLVISCPILIQATYEMVNPIDDPNAKQEGGKKWTLGAAIPKELGGPLIAAIKTASDEIMAGAGHKSGPYPHFLRDGGAKDSAGLYAKAGGKWSEFGYFSVKSKRCPIITERDEHGQIIDIGASELEVGRYALLNFSVIAITYGGAGGKLGTSAWINRIHFVGGGKALSGGGAREDADFTAMVDAASAAAPAPVESAAGGGSKFF
jgi:hypothetical protein